MNQYNEVEEKKKKKDDDDDVPTFEFEENAGWKLVNVPGTKHKWQLIPTIEKRFGGRPWQWCSIPLKMKMYLPQGWLLYAQYWRMGLTWNQSMWTAGKYTDVTILYNNNSEKYETWKVDEPMVLFIAFKTSSQT